MVSVFFWLTLLCFRLISADLFDPTSEELEKRFPIPALKSWGFQARKQKSVRVLAIGGSNTHSFYYATMLDGFLKGNISNTSFVLNYGASGHGPSAFTGKQYDFESWEHNKWPNIIMMEFSVNIDDRDVSSPFIITQKLETLYRSIKYKYRAAGFKQMPDFLFFSMFSVKGLYEQSREDTTIEARLKTLEILSEEKVTPYPPMYNGFNRGSMTNMAINEFAKFYDIPVISWADVAFPSAVRHYASSNVSYTIAPWAYSGDGLHLSEKAAKYVIENLFGPFFRQAMEPRQEEPYNEFKRYGFDLRMHAPSKVNLNIRQFSSAADAPESVSTFLGTIVDLSKSKHWKLQNLLHHEDDRRFACFGSNVAKSVVTFHFDIPSECGRKVNNGTCSINVNTIHSWNTTYIGPTYCELFRNHSTTHTTAIVVKGKTKSSTVSTTGTELVPHGNVTIDGRIKTGTYAQSSVVATQAAMGSHVLRCVNEGVSGQVSCVTGIDISGSMIL